VCDGDLRCSRPSRQPTYLQPCTRLVILSRYQELVLGLKKKSQCHLKSIKFMPLHLSPLLSETCLSETSELKKVGHQMWTVFCSTLSSIIMWHDPANYSWSMFKFLKIKRHHSKKVALMRKKSSSPTRCAKKLSRKCGRCTILF